MKAKSIVSLFVVVLASGCGGGGSSGSAAPPTTTPAPTASVSSVAPAAGANNVSASTTVAYTLAVTNATASDGTKLSFECNATPITFTSASVLTGGTIVVTLTPTAGAVIAGTTCTVSGAITTTGPGGSVTTSVSTSFSTATPTAIKALSLVAGTTNTPGSQDGTLLSASFYTPYAMTMDAQGNIYVVDGVSPWFDSHGLIRKISPTGNITTIAGSALYGTTPNYDIGTSQYSIANQAIFEGITGIATGSNGDLYTIDAMSNLIQHITPQGTVTTVAGARNQAGTTNGPALSARFQGDGIAADTQGNLFIADTANQTIRKIDASGNVTTFAGQVGVIGATDGGLQSALFNQPSVLKFDSAGNLYVGDQVGIRVIANGTVKTIIPLQQLMQDICLLPANMSPDGIDIATDGRIAVAYSNCSRVGIYQNNKISVVMGSYREMKDVDGSPSASRFYFPSGVMFLPTGDLLISDIGNANIKRYSASTNTVSLYAGQRNYTDPVDGVGSTAKLSNPFCLYHAASGNLWFSQNDATVRHVDTAGNVTTLFTDPSGMACIMSVNSDGSFIAASNQSEIRQYSASGTYIKTLATLGAATFSFPIYSATDANGSIYFTNGSGGISKYSGGVVSAFTDTINKIGVMSGLAFVSTGNLITSNGCAIFSVSSSGTVTQLTGTAFPVCGYRDGAAANALFDGIKGIAIGKNDEIYVVQEIGSVIRMISNGNVTTIAGTPWLNQTTIGPGQGAIYDPQEVAYDAATNSLVILTGNALLRAQLP